MLYLAVAAAAAFNLICTGTTEKKNYDGSTLEPYRVVYRIDTTARLWCRNDEESCKTPQTIQDINPVTIKFVDVSTDTPTQYFVYAEQVNRESGRHQTLKIGGRKALMRIEAQEGTCELAPFTGFTQTNPKF